ncbi:MAG: hypothetical protein JWM86_2675 [Thermoleophilia bacterium]|nr:hypothetical protein [Thermoleophilia bacterium]
MTPINPAAASGAAQYAGQGYAPYETQVDPYEGMDPYAYAQPDPYAAAYNDPYAAQYSAPQAASPFVDPYTGQPVDPYSQPYVPAGGQVSAQPYTGGGQVTAQPYMGGGQVAAQPYYPQAGTSPVAGTQPATTGAGPLGAQPANVSDFAALGVFDEQQLAALQASGMSPEELGALYDEVVVELQDPKVQEQLAAQQAAAQPGSAPSEGGAAKPGWNKAWKEKFRDALDAQGLDSKTQLLVLQQLGSTGIGDAELAQALEYYSSTPEGKAELKTVNEQVLAAKGQEHLQYAALGGLTLAAGAGTTLLARSQGNLVKSLSRAALTGTASEVSAATRMLAQLEKNGAAGAAKAIQNLHVRGVPVAALGTATESAIRAEAVSALRSRAGGTNRLLHPGKKMVYNAGARHLTEATKLSGKDMLKYALWMKQGDNVADVAKAGGGVSKVVAGGGAAAVDDAARAATRGVGAATGAATAAKGASLLSKVGKAAGPIGLVASAGFGIWGIHKTMEAEGGFGKESKKQTGNVAGGLAGGMAGAAAGAALGSVVPVIGTGVGAIVGGLIGGFGGGAIGEKLGGLF